MQIVALVIVLVWLLVSVVSLLEFYTYCLILGDVQISVTYGQGPSHQCLHNNDDVTLTCTINPLSNVVKWYHDTTKMVTCSNIKDYCVIIGGTSAYPRHNFTSSFANGEFTLRINPVSPGTDAGIYKCEHGGPSDGDSVSIEACGRFSCSSHTFSSIR